MAEPAPSTPRVLFVDDDSSVRSGLRRMLRRRAVGFEACFAGSAADALDQLGCRPASVVVSDMRMPGADGAELLGAVRDRCPGAARIVLSGQTGPGAALRSATVAHRFLDKPTSPELLLDTIHAVLAVQRRVDDPGLRDALGSIDTLPAPRARLERLEQALAPRAEGETCANANAGAVAALGTDVGLTARLFQLASSSFFTTGRPAHTTAGAVASIGLDDLRRLVERRALAHVAPTPEIAARCERLAGHAGRVVALAEELHGAPLPHETALGALLHDLGLLVAASLEDGRVPRALPPLRPRARTIGVYLLGLWGLPSAVAEAIAQPGPSGPGAPGAPMTPEAAVALAHALDAELEPDLHPCSVGPGSWADHWRDRRERIAEEAP